MTYHDVIHDLNDVLDNTERILNHFDWRYATATSIHTRRRLVQIREKLIKIVDEEQIKLLNQRITYKMKSA